MSERVAGDTKIIVADGHDVGASHGCARSAAAGLTSPRYTYWLTPSGELVEEGRSYRMRWVERFRGVRYARKYVLLRFKGAWEIDSEALDGRGSL